MFRALAMQLVWRIDEKRAPYVLIGTGMVYLVAFNTVLRDLDIWYFGFLLLVVVLCGPFLLRTLEPAVDKSEQSECGVVQMDIDR